MEIKLFENRQLAEAEVKEIVGWKNVEINSEWYPTESGYREFFTISAEGGLLHEDGFFR